MRIAKVITTKQMFSAKELQKTMHQDWKEDLQLFGNPDTQTLNHEQYSDALYQLIDEWSNGVEAVKLYEQLLLLILENSTKLDRDGNLVLRPLRAVPCCFQALCDLRARWQSKVTQWQAASNIGKDDLGNVRNEAVEKTKSTFSQQGIFKSIAEASRASSANSSGGRDMSAYLRQVFDSIDIDGSGSLDRDEVAQLSRNLGHELSPEELEAAMLEMDGDGGGEVEFEEFEDWYMNMLSSDEMIRVIFEQMDDDGSGTLEKAELGMLLAELGSPMSDVELDGVMRSIDVDNNGDVDVQEFSAWWRQYTSNELLSQAKVVEDPHAQYLLTFNNADSDGNGAIDKRELTALMLALGEDPTPNDLNLMMAVMDENNDGDITFEEFARWFSCVVGMPDGHDAAGAATTLEMDKVCAVAASLRDVFGEEEAALSPRAVRAAFLHCATGTEPASISFADLRTWWTEVEEGEGEGEGEEEESYSARGVMAACLRVLVNLTNDQPAGCALVASTSDGAAAEGAASGDGRGAAAAAAATSGLRTILRFLSLALAYGWHDSLVVAVGLLVNLVEQNDACCEQLAEL
eukprot:COSAG01_NODE_6435_length_3669_cov_1.367507_3_plen_574_part_01